jgi:hypothetical protein
MDAQTPRFNLKMSQHAMQQSETLLGFLFY